MSMENFLWFVVYLFVFIIGSIIGSFINVIIYRVPRKIQFVKGRSVCTSCGAQLKAYDLIPILSYLLLRGRCRKCKAKISPRYPLIEALTGTVALVSVWSFGFTFSTLDAFVFGAVLCAIAFIDIDTMTIPNALVIALIFPAVAAIFALPEVDLLSRTIGFFVVSAPLFLFTLFVPSSFGGGDIKLAAVCGLMLGWQNMLIAAFIALILGGIHGVFLLFKLRKEAHGAHMPFGQYICLGSFVALLFGEALIKVYLGMFGL